MLLPRLVAPHFLAIDWSLLRPFPYLILDVDNTIARCGAADLEEGVVERVQALRHEGRIRDLCLVSNVIVRTRHATNRLHRFAAMLGAHWVATGFWRRKPGPWGFVEALHLMGSRAEDTVVVGDQIYTDVLGGNRLGLFTILVQPLGQDHWTTRLTMRRRREARVLREFNQV